jgi:hypothetical protein
MEKSKLLELLKKEGSEYVLTLIVDDLYETSKKTKDIIVYLLDAVSDLREEIVKLQGCRAICQKLNLLTDTKGVEEEGPNDDKRHQGIEETFKRPWH